MTYLQRFREKFPDHEHWTRDALESHLKEEREQLIQEAFECVPEHMETLNYNQPEVSYTAGYNACREEMLSKLNQIK